MKGGYKNAPYTITEWQWLELQLTLFSLKFSGEKFSIYFEFPDENFSRDGKIDCAIFAEQTQALMKDSSSKEEQLEYYEGWADMARKQVDRIVMTLPVLSKTRGFNS